MYDDPIISRIGSAWKNFNKCRIFFSPPIKLWINVVLPDLSYASESWATKNEICWKLVRSMQRSTIKVVTCEGKSKEWQPGVAGIEDSMNLSWDSDFRRLCGGAN